MYSLIIVDDETKIREGIANLFPWKQNGFEITGLFPNGQLALDYLKDHPTDVVLTDIRMPVMNGLELSSHLARDYPEIIYVFLTGFQDFQYMRTAILNHASDYLLKPIKYEELYACFENIRQQLDQKYHVQPAAQPEGGSAYYGKIISKVCDYLKENYRTATLEEASSQVNLSPNYLSKIFKEKSGVGFAEYLNGIRMRKAAELLLDISYKHYEIADQIGYDNPKNFSRAFKQYYQMSPREFREKNLS
ncbi:MAG: response regulator [Candidatus Limivivens sp.]|nr:response regulator [Candidatus Limivivens sp.]